MRFHRLRVLRRFPHPRRAFTQGLLAESGTVWESTGLYGQSELRRYRLGASEPDASARLPAGLFGEGICRSGDHIWQLTWRERVALRWDADTLTLAETVPYNREGWGICHAGGCILTSDGSSELIRRDPRTLQPLGTVRVRCDGARVEGLNDLETHKTLSGDDVVAVFEHRQGPVIDGSPYADAGFVAQLEEYHQGAAMAHREHGPVPAAMPVPPKPIWMPEGAASMADPDPLGT